MGMVCFQFIRKMFQELEEIRPFEILKNQTDRSKYLLIKQSTVVAMTSTYASMKREEFLQLGFEYDNVIIEESAQISDIETFLPTTLQRRGRDRMSRFILLGDHHQLRPIVQNL